MSYKTCGVPLCKNTTIKTPHKMFIHVPKYTKIRKLWMNLARRDPKKISKKSAIYFCEDHFNLPDDMENYMEYKVMGTVKTIRMKPDCVPTKFACQSDRKKRTTSEPRLSTVIQQCRAIEKEAEEFNNTTTSSVRKICVHDHSTPSMQVPSDYDEQYNEDLNLSLGEIKFKVEKEESQPHQENIIRLMRTKEDIILVYLN